MQPVAAPARGGQDDDKTPLVPARPPAPPSATSFEGNAQVANQTFNLFCLGVQEGILRPVQAPVPVMSLSSKETQFFNSLVSCALNNRDLLGLIELLIKNPETVGTYVFSVLSGQTPCSAELKSLLEFVQNAEPFLEKFKFHGKVVQQKLQNQLEDWLTHIGQKESVYSPQLRSLHALLVETTALIFQLFYSCELFCSVTEQTYIYKALLKELFFNVVDQQTVTGAISQKTFEELTCEVRRAGEVAAICAQTDFLPKEAVTLLSTLIKNNDHLGLIVTGRVDLPKELDEGIKAIITNILHFLGAIDRQEQPPVISRILQHFEGAMK